MAVSKVFTSPAVEITPIPASLILFPPNPLPSALPAPSEEPKIAHPFTIPPNVFNSLLSGEVPAIAALIYVTTVVALNRYNKSRNHKPWAISRTRAFPVFVITHNIFLALFSAWTFVGLANAMSVALDGVVAENGMVGMVDALCKINGPRGLGDAATFDASTSDWKFTNPAMKLAAASMPDTTDVGRIWNEGLAFYGWIFYLSKLYEVVDTLIILARGKESSFLQTYHHAGVMICVWAGIRYMAPPIWMFVLINSFVHILMYTYFAVTAADIKVPRRIKRILTTLQILQLVVGTTYAFLHLFVAYTIPVPVPYIYSFADLTSNLASDIPSAVASTATASASAGLGFWLKKVAFRAAGEEGLAENVRNEAGEPFGIDAMHAATDLKTRQETRYRNELHLIHCIDTSGQVAAILLNCFYLAPLTWLFIQFFVRSYSNKGARSTTEGGHQRTIGEAGRKAATDVKRELETMKQGNLTASNDGSASQKSSRAESGAQPGRDGEEGRSESFKGPEDADILATAEAVKDALDGGLEPVSKSE